MKHRMLLVLLLLGTINSIAQTYTLENNQYLVSCSPEGEIVVKHKPSSVYRSFQADVMVAQATSQQKASAVALGMDGGEFDFPVVGWSGVKDLFSIPNTTYTTSKTTSVSETNQVLTFSYAVQPNYTLSATLTLPEQGEPVFEVKITSKKDGYYSIGYYGSPEATVSQAKEVWQPMAFNGLRVPKNPYLTPAFMCPLPMTMVTVGAVTYGVYADPSEFPFTPLPVSVGRSRFGVSLRNKLTQTNALKPMVWAPIMGTSESKLANTKTFSFKFRFYVTNLTVDDAYKDIATRQFGFGDYRHNDLGTLNEALDNVIDYGMHSTEVWSADMKGCRYDTDVPGSVKNTSAQDAYAVAFVTDDETILNERAYPIMEFLLSRKKVNYAPQTTTSTGQTATNELGNPCMNESELLQLYIASDYKMKALYEYALLRKSSAANTNENGIRQNVSFYEATHDEAWLKELVTGVDQYIQEEITTKPNIFEFKNHGKSSYWAQISPKFMELFEVYLATGETKYLEAARAGARMYAKFLWMCPSFTMFDSVLCNKGGTAPRYAGRKGTLISIPEEMAPAWRLSEQGLQTECGQTSIGGHRGVFTGNYAPTMRRIGALTADTFLMDIGKACVIGRYMSFPGYHINTDRTTVYEKADFPWHSLAQLLTTTSIHQSHIWPHIAKVMDYLVSDVAVLSHGQIDFPGRYVQNIVHMQNRVYMKDGVFYGDKGLVLYMPKQLLTVSNKELNYIAAWGNDAVYLVFTNQSGEHVDAQVEINSKYLTIASAGTTIWADNVRTGSGVVSNNKTSVSVSAHGITAIKIAGVTPRTKLQARMIPNTRRNEWNQYLIKDIEVGASRAMLLNPSDSLSRLFVYSSLECGTLTEYKISYRFNDEERWITMTDTDYPFEFSVTLDTITSIDFTLTAQGKTSDVMRFERLNPKATLSGWNTVTKAQGADITIDMEGESPFVVTYAANGKTQTEITDSTHLVMHHQPQKTTYYSLVEMQDATHLSASLTGDAKVVVVDAESVKQTAATISSAYVSASKATTSYVDGSVLELKGIPSSGREVYLMVNLDSVTMNSDEQMYIGLYMQEKTRLSKEGMVLLVELSECPSWTPSLTWKNKPSSGFTAIDTIGVSSVTATGQYIYWNISNWAEGKSGVHYLRLAYLDGENAAQLTFGGSMAAGQTPLLVVKSQADTPLNQVDEGKGIVEGDGGQPYSILGQPTDLHHRGIVLSPMRKRTNAGEYIKVMK